MEEKNVQLNEQDEIIDDTPLLASLCYEMWMMPRARTLWGDLPARRVGLLCQLRVSKLDLRCREVRGRQAAVQPHCIRPGPRLGEDRVAQW